MKKFLFILTVWLYFQSGKVLEFKTGCAWKWSPGWSSADGITILDKDEKPICYIDTTKDDVLIVTKEKPIERSKHE